jgi:hypothetical protein
VRCSRCQQPLPSGHPRGDICSTCAERRALAISRRDFLARAGLAGLASLSLPSVLDACNLSARSTIHPPSSRSNVFDANWEPAVRRGIQVGQTATGTTWYTGHVNDILELTPESILVASESSGVWLLTAGFGIPLSLDWENTWMNALAAAPDPRHANRLRVFAGGGVGSYTQTPSALYVTDTSAEAPLLAPWIPIEVDATGTIHDILLLADPQSDSIQHILLATETGLYWSPIPDDPHGTYTWQSPAGAPPFGCGFWSLAPAPNNGFIAGAYYNNPAQNHYGIYAGTWDISTPGSPRLTVSRATMTGFDVTQMSTTSVASCASDPTAMYAICAQEPPPNSSSNAGSPYVVLRATDGASEWTGAPPVLATPVGPNGPEYGGNGRDWGNCIAVAPNSSNLVAFAWVTGPYVSVDGANTFFEMQRGSTHDDKHALVFSSSDGDRVYLGCDGGVAFIRNADRLITTLALPTARLAPVEWEWDYSYSQWLANLQFVTPSNQRFFWGRLGVTGVTVDGAPAHLIGGGLQDNDDVYAVAFPNGASQPWKPVTSDSFDGGWVVFPGCGGALHATAGLDAYYSQWNGASLTGNQLVPIRLGRHDTQLTLSAKINLVPSPTFRNSNGQLLYAVGAKGTDVWGLYANADGSDMHWEYRFSVPLGPSGHDQILSLASAHGTIIYVGVWPSGTVYRADFSASPVQPVPSTGIPAGTVAGIVMDPSQDKHAYAILIDTPAMAANGVYQTTSGHDWHLLDGLPATVYYCLDARWHHPQPYLFVGTDDAVWGSPDGGANWHNISTGLPRRALCSDLRYFYDQSLDKHYLYLSTYGWSVWRAELHDPQP